jgi:hypothetical protein
MRSRTRVVAQVAFAVALVALAVGYYFVLGVGPTPSEKPEDIAWWRPWGLALRSDWAPLAPLQEIAADVEQARHEGRFEPRGLIPLALSAVPPILAVLVGLWLFRAPAARVPILALGITLGAFGYYGWLDPETWLDYSWRWPATLLVTATYLAAFLLAPSLVRAVRARPGGAQAAALLAFAAPIYVLSIEVTGTNSRLQWNVSPWPTVTLYGFLLCGFLLFGLVLGVIHLAAGVGLLVRGRAAGAARTALAAAVAAGLAAALRPIPFATSGALQLGLLALPAALLAALVGRRSGDGRPALAYLLAGGLVLANIKVGQWQGEAFLAQARDEIAPRVIAALERHREERGSYPEELPALVPSYLPEIPLPSIGWLDSGDETFMYTVLGDSFLLEFPHVLWVQCAYSPAYAEEEATDEETADAAESNAAADDEEPLPATWSCESKPPRLW